MSHETLNTGSYYCGGPTVNVRESEEEVDLTRDAQNRKCNNAYTDVPIKSFSRETTVSIPYYKSNSKLEPNFNSDAYKVQAKEIFNRRMTYNPREAASKSRERYKPQSPYSYSSPLKFDRSSATSSTLKVYNNDN